LHYSYTNDPAASEVGVDTCPEGFGMNLLSFRTPVLYAACHRCGNALTHGEEECPHCGTNQSRALRAPNSVDFNNSNIMMMPGRMLVPYPSVPEEVDTAMNIARERARVVRRVAFGVAGGGLLAVALALTYAPGLRSPVVQRLAALPEPARPPAFVPVATDTAPKAAVPASTTTVVAAAKPAAPVPVSAARPPAVNLVSPPAATYAAAPPLTQAPAQTPTQTQTQTPTPATTLTSAQNRATEMIASIMNKLTTAAVALRAQISTLAMSPATEPVTTATPDAPAPVTATTATTTTNDTNAPSPVAAPVSKSPNNAAPITLTQNTTTPPLTDSTYTSNPAPVISTPAPLAALPPAPSPSAVADVPIASHAPQPSTPAEQELPKLSLPPVSAVIATERPPLGSPGESLYFARLALVTNDLSAAQKNLANVPANQVNSPDVQRVRDDLAQREAARDTAMQHARACDQSASWRCARRYAKDALAIDSSYTDSRVFLKHVAIKIAEAKKAAEAAAVQTAAIMQRGPMHPAPIREAVAIPRTAPMASTSGTPTTTGASAPHLFANPVVHAPRETHVTHEAQAREVHAQQEALEPVVAFQPVRNADAESSESKAPDNGAPIRAAGRGEAH
jgi:ribosomal protein L37E